jgi:hypothetical protein
MSKPALNCSGIMASIRQCKAAGMSKHVGVDFDLKTASSPFDQSAKASRGERRSSLADEHEWPCPLQPSQGPELIPLDRMG